MLMQFSSTTADIVDVPIETARNEEGSYAADPLIDFPGSPSDFFQVGVKANELVEPSFSNNLMTYFTEAVGRRFSASPYGSTNT
jgi:hypothetical protein